MKVAHLVSAVGGYAVEAADGQRVVVGLKTVVAARSWAKEREYVLLEPPMTDLHLQALLNWRRRYGKQWKKALRGAWSSHGEGVPVELKSDFAFLQQLYQPLGWQWLLNFTLPENK